MSAVLPGITGAMVTRNAIARSLKREADTYGIGGQLDLARRLGVSPDDVRGAIRQMPAASMSVARALGYVQHPNVDAAYCRRDIRSFTSKES